MPAKQYNAKRGMNFSNKEENKSNTGNNIDLDQAKHKYQLQL